MRNTRISLVIVAVLLVTMFGGQLVFLATDWLWFSATGYEPTFRTMLLAQVGSGAGVAALAFALLLGNGIYAARTQDPGGIRLADEEFAETPLGQMMQNASLPRLVALASAVLAVLIGASASGWWDDVLLFAHAADFDYAEPLLGLNAGFYVFQLPLLLNVQSMVALLLFLALAMSGGLYLFTGAVRADLEEIRGQVYWKGLHVAPQARTHIGALASAVLLTFGAGAYLGRYRLLYSDTGLIAGPGYADSAVTMNLMLLQAGAAVVAAVLVFVGMRRDNGRQLVAAGVGTYILAFGLTSFVPGMVQRYYVAPTEFALEEPYIAHHIEATRRAYDLDGVETRALTGANELSWADVQAADATIKNVRLWDHEPLLTTFAQVQEIRTFYDFASVDNDRYMIDGELRQIMLSPREVDVRSLPDRSRTWVSETMVYTHGYGLALGPVNEVTEEGLPQLFVKDLPPQISKPDDIQITQPAIYYGEAMDNEVLVQTRNQEFDYQRGEEEVYGQYSGTGGVAVGGMLTRAMFALRFESMNMLLTSDVEPDSRVMLYRNVLDRVDRIAPFLLLDPDPYLVIASDGRLVWVADAYTAASQFPYSKSYGSVNYMRNSVKVTVDAYDGTVTFYDMGTDDPIVAAWRGAFPDMFQERASMPDWLVAHLRYPQFWFSLQTRLYATYHVTSPNVYFSGTDDWEVPVVEDSRMQPYYTVMTLPGETEPEFIEMLPFNPVDKPNLASWMVARSDGDAYGNLLAYTFPKDKVIYGPGQISAFINQDAEISEKLTLWNQQGSRAKRGTMLVIPIQTSLVYIQPLYLRSDNDSLPLLKRVIVGYGNQVKMAPTLMEALALIEWADGPGQLDMSGAAIDNGTLAAEAALAEAGGDPARAALASDANTAALVAEANAAYLAATEAQRAGDWARYGAELEKLGEALRRLEGGEGIPEAEEPPAASP